MSDVRENLGARPLRPPALATRFPEVSPGTGRAAAGAAEAERPAGAVDVLLVNPPAPDGAIWIRSQHRVGRRSRENMIWPQVSLAQLAAMLHPDHRVEVIDAIPGRMTWEEFGRLVAEKRPRYYVTQVTAPTLTNDLRGTFVARSLGATTIAFGTHVTPLPRQTMQAFPSLDFVLRGEPELTLRELVDALETAAGRWEVDGDGLRRPDGRRPDAELGARLRRMQADGQAAEVGCKPAWLRAAGVATTAGAGDRRAGFLEPIPGLVWRDAGGGLRVNADRPLIRNLDDLPLPLHHLLPWAQHRAPSIRGPYTFVVTARGCPAGCTFCIKHVSYQQSVRVRSPENILAELRMLRDLPPSDGTRARLRNVHMYADLFTVSREQVMGLCRGMVDEGLGFRWTCNSRVDYVDPEMLQAMARAGCWLISWGIESASDEVRQRAHKGTSLEKISRALEWSKAAGIMNWGYFIIGLPGETEETIRQTIDLAKKLPLDLALFHIAAPYPGTPFFFESLENGWFRPGTTWEEVDMDESTVLDYPGLPGERIEYWARRAFREWALRPGPMWTFLRSMNSRYAVRSALNVGWQALGWMK